MSEETALRRVLRGWLEAFRPAAAETARGERQRVPAPVIPWRIASGGGASEQPNVAGGEARLDARCWVMVVLTGVATGLFADLLMWVLFGVQHLAFDYRSGQMLPAVERVSDARLVAVLAIGGVFGGVAWYLLRRFLPRERTEMDDIVWSGDGELGARRSLATSLISEVVIAMGASLGREAAPKLMGGVSGSVLSAYAALTPAQRRLLIACGGGAGLAAVYNVPLGGALFTAEVLCGGIVLTTILPALVCAAIATVTGWIYLPNRPTYVGIPDYRFSFSFLVSALVLGLVAALVAVGYIRLIGWVSHHQVQGARILFAFPAALVALGLVGIAYPEVLGNGQDIAQFAFLGRGGLGLLLVLFALKPLATALCLGSGGSGGLFTPTLSVGALLGALLGGIWTHLWPGSPVGAFAMVGAVALIGAAMQAPLTAGALVLELTHSGFGLTVPMIVAVATATSITNYLDGYSIYSARLRSVAPRATGASPG